MSLSRGKLEACVSKPPLSAACRQRSARSSPPTTLRMRLAMCRLTPAKVCARPFCVHVLAGKAFSLLAQSSWCFIGAFSLLRRVRYALSAVPHFPYGSHSSNVRHMPVCSPFLTCTPCCLAADAVERAETDAMEEDEAEKEARRQREEDELRRKLLESQAKKVSGYPFVSSPISLECATAMSAASSIQRIFGAPPHCLGRDLACTFERPMHVSSYLMVRTKYARMCPQFSVSVAASKHLS